MAGGYPNVTLVGPFTYNDTRIKSNITWSDDGTIVYFTYDEFYTFIDAPCNGSVGTTNICSLDPFNTTITSVNAPMVGVLFTIVPILKSKYEFLTEVERLFLDALTAEIEG